MWLLKAIGKSKALEWYVNLYSNGLNQSCDPCWFMSHGIVAFLLGLDWVVGFTSFGIVLILKLLSPTDHDKGLE